MKPGVASYPVPVPVPRSRWSIERLRCSLLATACSYAAAVLLLTSCGVDVNSQTQLEYTPADGVQAEAGELSVRGVVVVSAGDGSARVLAGIANNGASADQLVGLDVAGVSVELPADGLQLPPDGFASLGIEGAPSSVASGTPETVAPGRFVPVTFVFAAAPRVSVDALVQSPDGIYATLAPTPVPTS